MRIGFTRCNEDQLSSVVVKDGTLLFTKDKNNCYLDNGSTRSKISDIIFINNTIERDAITSPLSNKLYYIASIREIQTYDGTDWYDIFASSFADRVFYENGISQIDANNVQDAIDFLVNNLGNTNEDLLARIEAEKTERENADTILQSNIDEEELARITADTTLQGNIDTEISNRIQAISDLADTLDTEIADRISAVETVQDNLDAETLARTNADTQLQVNIDSEEASRIAADIQLQENLDTEEATRISEDDILRNRIALEEQTREGAVDDLQNKLDAEETSRVDSDNTINERIDEIEFDRLSISYIFDYSNEKDYQKDATVVIEDNGEHYIYRSKKDDPSHLFNKDEWEFLGSRDGNVCGGKASTKFTLDMVINAGKAGD